MRWPLSSPFHSAFSSRWARLAALGSPFALLPAPGLVACSLGGRVRGSILGEPVGSSDTFTNR